MAELIVFDVYGTLFGGTGNKWRRQGVEAFMHNNPDAQAVLYTDASLTEETEIREVLQDMGIYHLFDAAYFKDSMDEGHNKNLALVASQMGVGLEDMVMIGDSRADATSAHHYGVRGIYVPNVLKGHTESERLRFGGDPIFSFERLGNVEELLMDNEYVFVDYNDKKFVYKSPSYEILLMCL